MCDTFVVSISAHNSAVQLRMVKPSVLVSTHVQLKVQQLLRVVYLQNGLIYK